MKGVLMIVAAPSGAGKTSLVRALVEREPEVFVSVSHTTRPQRPGDVDGKHYHFIDEDRFRAMVSAGEFVEHANVFGNLYGTSIAAIREPLDAGHDIVLEIDWQGAQQVRKQFKDAISVFILPPSKATLLERLSARGQDDAAVIEKRMASAVAEMSHYDEFDFVIVNDRFELAVAELTALLRADRLRQGRRAEELAPLIAELLNQ
ncbi:MAG: guanylate kinase [Pseudomonadaceae bacterium]|nr:guanylate kinase [Pseudomonadaceae bacterium]